MKRRTFVGVAVASVSMPAAAQMAPDLSQLAPGSLGSPFMTTQRTGRGALGEWRVVLDPSAATGRAIEQTSADPTDYRFPLAVLDAFPLRNVEASVRFKAVDGKVDRAGGLVVRLIDSDNYYVVRANALEDNVNLYRVVKGVRQELRGTSVKVPSGEWHMLGLKSQGKLLTVTFDGKTLFSHEDGTFVGPGKVALWTKADSITRFEALEVKSLD